MKFNGKVYGKINGKYIELTVEDHETVKTPKRTPDKNGVLPLTKKELREFDELVGHKVCSVVIAKDTLIPHFLCFKTPEMTLLYCNTLTSFKAILWLPERFELNGGE